MAARGGREGGGEGRQPNRWTIRLFTASLNTPPPVQKRLAFLFVIVRAQWMDDAFVFTFLPAPFRSKKRHHIGEDPV